MYQAISDLSASDLRKAESYALPFALVVLVLVFGSLVAASLPVIGGAFAVSVTLGAMFLIAPHYDLSIFVMNVASMLGLAVGIDYSLFMVGRFREELASGAPPWARPWNAPWPRPGAPCSSAARPWWPGCSAFVSFRYMSLRSMGIGGAVVVLFSVLSALTLLPALLGVLGPRVDALRLVRRTPGESAFWRRWSDWVMAHPVVVLVGTIAVILALAGPVLRITVNVPTATELPRHQEARRGFGHAALVPVIPALLTRTSTLPNSASAAATAAFTSATTRLSALRQSAATPSRFKSILACSRLSCLKSVMATLAPRAPSTRACDSPNPVVPPVMKTVLYLEHLEASVSPASMWKL